MVYELFFPSELYVFICPKVCGLLMEALHVTVLCVAGRHPHLTPNLLLLVFTGLFPFFFCLIIFPLLDPVAVFFDSIVNALPSFRICKNKCP